MTQDNSIIAKIRQTREAILAEHNGDLASLVKHLQQRTAEAARDGRTVSVPTQPQTKSKENAPTRKVG